MYLQCAASKNQFPAHCQVQPSQVDVLSRRQKIQKYLREKTQKIKVSFRVHWHVLRNYLTFLRLNYAQPQSVRYATMMQQHHENHHHHHQLHREEQYEEGSVARRRVHEAEDFIRARCNVSVSVSVNVSVSRAAYLTDITIIWGQASVHRNREMSFPAGVACA